MSSFLSTGQKTSLQAPFHQIHDTWKRPVYIFKTAQEVVIQTSPANNDLFPSGPLNDQTQTTIVSGVFDARIQWNPKQDFRLFSDGRGNDIQNTLKILDGAVRLKVDATGKAMLDGIQRCKIDGYDMELMLTDRPHGLFIPDFSTFYFKRVN